MKRRAGRVEVPAGSRFGRWTVLGDSDVNLHGHRALRCRCDCGHEKALAACRLRRGEKPCCGACNPRVKYNAERGNRFGAWTVLRTSMRDERVFAVCRCDCGNEGIVRVDELGSGHSTGCRRCQQRRARARAERAQSVTVEAAE